MLIRNAVPWSGCRLDGDTIAIANGVIAGVGSLDDVRALAYPAGPEIDAGGGLVTAGFGDCHIHLGVVAMDALQCNLAGATSIDECLSRVAAFAASSSRPWVSGGGWDLALFNGGYPTAAQLDTVVSDRPALLLNADHHGAWLNSAALRAAGIEASTPDPADGRIERNPDGTPSGMLNEGAVQLVARVMPSPSTDELARAIGGAADRVLATGITTWQEAALGAYGGFPDFTDAYREALARGLVRGRPSGAIWTPRDLTVERIPGFLAGAAVSRDVNTASGFPTPTIKLMLDGIVETRTAALRDPYLGDGADGSRGLSYFDPEFIQRLISAANAEGFAVHVHAIGDRAVGDALDGFAAAAPEDRAAVRNHIAHVQLIDERDVPRFAALGVTANLQPFWAYESQLTRQRTIPLLGEHRASRLFVFGELQRAGARTAMGSDWPVSDFDPWQGIHVAVTRRAPGDTVTPPLAPEQALTLEYALDAYTRGSAELLGEGTGLLRVGERADLAIANRNPFEGDEADIHLTSTRATVVDGVLVAGE